MERTAVASMSGKSGFTLRGNAAEVGAGEGH
jgi:hypothetical protein